MTASALRDQAAALRGFSRFYTQRMGILQPELFESGLPLAAARTVYELGQQAETTARALGARLAMDAGQLSRLLAGLRRKGLLRERTGADRRSKQVGLSAAGRQLYRQLDRRSQRQAEGLLQPLAASQRHQLAASLQSAQQLLGGEAQPRHGVQGPRAGRAQAGRAAKPRWGPRQATRVPAIRLRPPRPGDMGWIVHRQGALYASEYGWDTTFEGLVAEIVAGFLRANDSRRERCWIAESGGAIAGSIFLVRESDAVAKLRLLYVEPAARGQGIGQKLVAACVAFAREAGYRTITLYTNDILVSARRIYEAAGFTLTKEWKHHSYGKDLTGQIWDLKLSQP